MQTGYPILCCEANLINNTQLHSTIKQSFDASNLVFVEMIKLLQNPPWEAMLSPNSYVFTSFPVLVDTGTRVVRAELYERIVSVHIPSYIRKKNDGSLKSATTKHSQNA